MLKLSRNERRIRRFSGTILRYAVALFVTLLLYIQLKLNISSNPKDANNPQNASVNAQTKRYPTIRSVMNSLPSKPSDDLPRWIRDYVSWHRSVRAKFPGANLFTDPAAPNLLIRTCLGLCGGLNDRLGQLPWDLYLANQTGRILLLHWHRPVPLEHFLLPNELDWSVPKDIHGFFSDSDVRVSRGDLKYVRSYKELFESYESEKPTDIFWESHLDLALERAKYGEFKNQKVLRHRILGHLNEVVLEERLRALGETDMIHWTPSFGKIFCMFFKPSLAIQSELDSVYQTLQIKSGHYSAVHCRVRHPKATAGNIYIKGKNSDYPADKSGLPWEGETRNFAIDVATRAIQCAQHLLDAPQEPIYFFSDSNDLVRHISQELYDPKFLAANATMLASNPAEVAALRVVESTHIVAREANIENAHIDRQKGRDPPAYYGTFVDLLLAVNARCVTFGVGFYAVLATKISGTSCKLLYQEEAWGGSEAKRMNSNLCPRTKP